MSDRRAVKIPRQPDGFAVYLAWCAYPGLTESNRRARLRLAKAILAAHHKVRFGGHAPEPLRGIKPDRAKGTINRGLNRITRRRIRAAWMALHRMPISEDPDRGEWGLNESARMLIDSFGTIGPEQGPVVPEREHAYHNDDPFNPGNVKRLIWYESLPVLPMVFALPLDLASQQQASVLDLFRSNAWAEDAVASAQKWAGPVERFFEPGHILIPAL